MEISDIIEKGVDNEQKSALVRYAMQHTFAFELRLLFEPGFLIKAYSLLGTRDDEMRRLFPKLHFTTNIMPVYLAEIGRLSVYAYGIYKLYKTFS